MRTNLHLTLMKQRFLSTDTFCENTERQTSTEDKSIGYALQKEITGCNGTRQIRELRRGDANTTNRKWAMGSFVTGRARELVRYGNYRRELKLPQDKTADKRNGYALQRNKQVTTGYERYGNYGGYTQIPQTGNDPWGPVITGRAWDLVRYGNYGRGMKIPQPGNDLFGRYVLETHRLQLLPLSGGWRAVNVLMV
jgi:hypothetical protein